MPWVGCSSGNHAAALALAAQLRAIPSYIVVPSNTPQCKVDAIKAYGGEVPSSCPCSYVTRYVKIHG